MIWQNPWAWLGLLALGVPVLIHLLGRRSARAQRFPTLRFIEATAPVATRRTRLTDVPLLLVRMGILAAAVTALALPLLLTANRERDLGRAVARAIIVDTSTSMIGVSSGPAASGATGAGTADSGSRGLDVARREASRRASEAGASVVIETAAPARALRGASAWLEHQHGRREIVMLSDFQTGTIDSVDIAGVPRDVGIDLVPVATTPLTALPAVATPWEHVVLLAGGNERPHVDAARQAAIAVGGALATPDDRSVAIVYDSFEGRDSLAGSARPLSAAWQGNVLAVMRANPLLADAAATANPSTTGDAAVFGDPPRSPFAAVARTGEGWPIVVAAAGDHEGRDRLLLFVRGQAGSLVSAATLVALASAAAPSPDVSELEPSRLDEAALSAWRRQAASATSTRSSDDPGQSDGRWLWALALLLLGVESWMRRGRREVKVAEVVHERAA